MRPALPLQKPSKPGRFTYFYRLRQAARPASIDVIVGWRQIKFRPLPVSQEAKRDALLTCKQAVPACSEGRCSRRGKAGRFTYM
jgi:hypothetical protein